jgi:hypothetical protein
MNSPRQSATVPISNLGQSASAYLEQSLSNVGPTLSSGSLQSSRFPITADAYQAHYQQMTSSSFNGTSVDAQRSPRADDSRSFMASSEQFSTYPLYNWSYRQHQPVLTPSTLPPLSYYYRAHSLEDVAPRDTIMLIIALFFDFVYPLSPCVHKPSYMADLHARREERDPLFFALVMSTVASTLVQLPRSYLPMGRLTVRKLAQTCHEASRHISVASYDPPTSMHVVIRYLWAPSCLATYVQPTYPLSSDCIYHFCEGHDATQHAAFGEAAHIAVTLRMHEESSYEGLDLIECEVRRRTFWLLFGGTTQSLRTSCLPFSMSSPADKTMSVLLGRPICLRDEDCTVNFPKELDDE